MKYEFIVKIERERYERERGRLLVMLGSFIVALLIYTLYSMKTALLMLVPITFVLFRFRGLKAKGKYWLEAVCTLALKSEFMELTIQAIQVKLCSRFRIKYSDIISFSIENREIHIEFVDGSGDHRSINFFIKAENVETWEKIREVVVC